MRLLTVNLVPQGLRPSVHWPSAMVSQTRYQDDVIEIVTRGRVLGNRWVSRPSLAALQRLTAHQREFVTSLDDGRHVVLSILEPSAGLRFDESMRKAAAALASEMRPHTIALGQLVRGSGFFASASRAVLSGVQLAARPGYPMRVFGDDDACGSWLAQQLEYAYPSESAGDVAAVLEQLS